MVKIAVLDDFVGNAHTSADWSQLPSNAEVDFFHEHLNEEEAAQKLRAEGWRTIAALSDTDDPAALGCSHRLEGGAAGPL